MNFRKIINCILAKEQPKLLLKRESGTLITVSGCTGTGKSDLGIAIAKEFNGEVISADSMQIYRGLSFVHAYRSGVVSS